MFKKTKVLKKITCGFFYLVKMELEFDKELNTVRKYRPYINQEEGSRSIIIYNPEGGPFYGLYTPNPYPLCADKCHACYVEQNKGKNYYNTKLFPHERIYS